MFRLTLLLVLSSAISGAQSAAPPLDPPSPDIFYLLDSSSQTLKPLPIEQWKKGHSSMMGTEWRYHHTLTIYLDVNEKDKRRYPFSTSKEHPKGLSESYDVTPLDWPSSRNYSVWKVLVQTRTEVPPPSRRVRDQPA